MPHAASSSERAPEQAATPSVRTVSPTILPSAVRHQLFFLLSILVILVAIGSPSSGMFGTALPLLLKSKLHLGVSEQSSFLALAAIPVFLSPIFGFIRDLWNPFGMRDRGFILLFGSLTVALYIFLAFVPVTWATLLGAFLLLSASFRLVSSATNGLLAVLGQQHTMSGQVGVLWSVVLWTIAAASSLLGGRVSDLLAGQSADAAFHSLFLVGAAAIAGVVLYGWLRPAVVFDNIRAERQGAPHPINDLTRLLKYWPVYPALLIWLLWNFAPGSDTSLRNYLQDTFHATGTQWGEWNAIFSLSFIPTALAFGFLCTSTPLGRLLVWGTLIGVPQMVPLLFIHSMNDAFVAAIPMGLMGGIASAAYVSLIIRSCPPGLQGTVMMLSFALESLSLRLGDRLGTYLSYSFGGFQICVIAITIVYALILPVILLVPRRLIVSPDGEMPEATSTQSPSLNSPATGA